MGGVAVQGCTKQEQVQAAGLVTAASPPGRQNMTINIEMNGRKGGQPPTNTVSGTTCGTKQTEKAYIGGQSPAKLGARTTPIGGPAGSTPNHKIHRGGN